MSSSTYKRLTNKIIDWLIAFLGASFLLWFVITQPIFDNTEIHNNSLDVDTQKLKNHVELLTGGYAPRTVNYDNLNHTADYIYQQFSTIGIPEYQYVTTISNQYKNVYLQLGPDTQELYIIGAHYDAEDDSIDSEGNASGVAALIELARHLAENNNQLDIGVILVAYPLSLNQSDSVVNTGSYFHAKSLKTNNKIIRLMISLDSIGQIGVVKEKPFKFMDLLYPDIENSINLIGRLNDFASIRDIKKSFKGSSNLSLQSHNLPENFYKTNSSDHINYWRQGFPAVLISDKLYGNNTTSNQSNISPSARLNYVKIADLVDGLYQTIMQASSDTDSKTQLVLRSRNKQPNTVLH